ncbi:hypothetical protein ACCO45_010911 [Purpureocillium lilacinum]|uniref:Uncharacterized protein n=1 Tax=Purpureocillium lilacinum TaxID=33203 RepID=A0ACC4DGY1_PURLI
MVLHSRPGLNICRRQEKEYCNSVRYITTALASTRVHTHTHIHSANTRARTYPRRARKKATKQQASKSRLDSPAATMLLAEDPATLIHHTINNFNIQPDKLAVARVTESLSTLQQARDLRVRDAEASLRKLARQLATLESQHEHEAAAHSSPADHASRIATLDTQKFRTAKAASDAEMEAERLASRAADLAARLQELDLQGVEGDLGSGGDGGRRGRTPSMMRSSCGSSLGIDIERDGRDGEWSRAVVRNDRKGDVHVVNMDKKFSRFFYANYFWQTL